MDAAVTLQERPGYVDLGAFAAPESGGQFVEINVQGVLLSLAARIVAAEEPAVAEIIRGLHAVRVNVVTIDDSNREVLLQRIDSIRENLQSKGWESVATVRDGSDNVAVYVKSGEGETIEGVTLTVLNGTGEAVFINVVGNIQPEQIAMLGERLDIEPLKRMGTTTGS